MRNRLQTARLCVVIAVSALAPLAAVRAQDAALPDAETILDRFVEVTGGQAAYDDRHSQVVHGRMEVPAAQISGDLMIYQDSGNNYYTSINIPGIGLVETGVTNGVAWENSALQGARIKTGAEKAQAIREATMNASADWRELFPKVETVGIETIDGEQAYSVLMTPEAGGAQTIHFSVSSGLALRTDLVAATQLGDIPMQQTLADYKEFGGVLLPTTMTQSIAGQTIRLTLESVETNVEIPAGRFDLPDAVKALIE